MTVELWSGDDYEYRHEVDALSSFLDVMVEHYGEDTSRYLVMANFIIDNQLIDMAVLKRNAVIVIELKEVGGMVVGGENGPWMVGESGSKKTQLSGGGHGNPFLQVRKYHQTMIGFLQRNQSRFLNPRSGRRPALHHVAALICLSPTIPEGSQITLPRLRWLRLVGLDQLHLEVYRERSPELNFSKREMYSLVRDVMRLRKKEISEYTGTKKVQPPESPLTIDLPAMKLNDIAKEYTRQRHNESLAGRVPAQEMVTKPEPVEAKESIESKVARKSLADCFMCRISESRCDTPAVRGVILKAGSLHEGVRGFLIDTGEIAPVEVALEGEWESLVDKFNQADERMPAAMQGDAFSVAIYHLYQEKYGLVARDDSLVLLEPNWLINVTDLTRVEYCQRQLLLGRYTPFIPNEASMRGTMVHQLFPTIWASGSSPALEQERQQLMISNAEAMVWANVDPNEIADDVSMHLMHLIEWAGNQKSRNTKFRSETFVLSPRVGMKGRIDGLWELDNKPRILGELKTGKSQGRNPRPGHAFQLLSYELALLSNEDIDPKVLYAILLYSGNDRLGSDGRNVIRRVEYDPQQLRKTVHIRNELVFIDHTGEAQFDMNPNKCNKCRIALDCARLALLGGHRDQRAKPGKEWLSHDAQRYTGKRAESFRHYASLLTSELKSVKVEHSKLWSLSPQERLQEGRAFKIGDSNFVGEDDSFKVYAFGAESGRNESEFRAGDSVLISGPEGPGSGRNALGTVRETTLSRIVVRTYDEIHFKPVWLDLYTDERLTEHQFSGQFQFLRSDNPLVDILLEDRLPTFSNQIPDVDIPRHFGEVEELNEDQEHALTNSLRMNDFMLVLGPPGSGKTMLIEHMVRAHLMLNRRILISAGTNRAIDEVLKRLVMKDLGSEVLRLGSVGRCSKEVQPYLMSSLMEKASDYIDQIELGKEILKSRRVIGSTTHTLLTGRYDRMLGNFDLVIVDEAAQLTTPLVYGPLRFGSRFILIGDHKQLPSVVMSKPRARTDAALSPDSRDNGLDVSLFELLIQLLEDNDDHGLVRLKAQYRMNKTICEIPSKLWYGKRLTPANKNIRDGKIQFPLETGDVHPSIAPEKPVIFIDVPADHSAGPRTNIQEARAVRKVVRELVVNGVRLSETGKRGQIAVIAPFRAQVALIRRELEDEFEGQVEAIHSMVDTVDRFQGSESDIVIVSLATYGTEIHELLKDERRLNVALTRAKHKLIIMGSLELLMKDPTYYALINTIDEATEYTDWLLKSECFREEG